MKYIDAEKLRKLLTNRYEEITVPVLTDEGGLESFYRRSEIHNILKIVDSLQQEQPDVDLEEEIDKVIADYSFTKTIDSGGFKTTILDYAKIAHHFYELGLNARKEE